MAKQWLSRRKQAQRYGVTVRSLERWAANPDLGLPPETEINGRFYREEGELDRWDKARVVATAAKRKRAAESPNAAA